MPRLPPRTGALARAAWEHCPPATLRSAGPSTRALSLSPTKHSQEASGERRNCTSYNLLLFRQSLQESQLTEPKQTAEVHPDSGAGATAGLRSQPQHPHGAFAELPRWCKCCFATERQSPAKGHFRQEACKAQAARLRGVFLGRTEQLDSLLQAGGGNRNIKHAQSVSSRTQSQKYQLVFPSQSLTQNSTPEAAGTKTLPKLTDGIPLHLVCALDFGRPLTPC